MTETTSATRHALQFGGMLITVGIAWGVLSTKVDALQDSKQTVEEDVREVQATLNDNKISIAELKVTTKNIEKNNDAAHDSFEKQMETQQRILEDIAKQLRVAPPSN